MVMKALLLASTLGFTLTTNVALAAVPVQDSAVWRTDTVKVENADKEVKKSSDWQRTQFNPVKKDAKKLWRNPTTGGWRKFFVGS